MGTSGNKDCQWTSRAVLKDFTEDTLTISAGILYQNGTARMVKAYLRVQNLCWWNLWTWSRSPLRVELVKEDSLWNSRRPWVILDMDIRFTGV